MLFHLICNLLTIYGCFTSSRTETKTMKLNYDIRQRKKASTLLALASTEIEAANALIEMKLFREAVVHLYFASFYVSQSLLRQKLGAKPSHPAVESQLHKVCGRSPDFPRRYVELHSRLHKLRTEIHYRSARSPQPSTLRRDARYLVTAIGGSCGRF